MGQPAIVREAEIDTIKDWLDNDEIGEVEISHLSPGDRITIATGKFKGREAIINKMGKNV